MEQYLNSQQISTLPIGKKYKKTTYGGSKVFIRQIFTNKKKIGIILEFFLHKGSWQIELKEQQKALKKGVDSISIKRFIGILNTTQIKKAVNLKLNKEEYQKLYSLYPDADNLGYYALNSPEYVRVIDILNSVHKNSIIYDVGCNSGGIGRLLIQKRKCQVVGSEICPHLANKAKEKGVHAVCCWAEKTPFQSNYFDYAILSFILEHVISPDKVLQETLRVLKNNGQILGHVPTEYGDWGKNTIGIHPEHLRAYTKQELKNLLEKFKLKSIIVEKRKLVGRRVADYYFFKASK